MKARIHITGASAISPQPSFDREALDGIAAYDAHPLHVIMPDIAGYVDPIRVRRMTRSNRMGLLAALNALKRAGIDSPGAIIAATGDGCKESVERFLDNLIDSDEAIESPTAFIGSTHNSLAGLIALALKSNAYNYTYLQRGLSFPSALLDGLMQVGEEGVRHALVGAADVITADFFRTHRASGLWKERPVRNLDVLQSADRGAIAGEGAAFFVLDSEPTAGSVELLGADACFSIGDHDLGAHASSLLDPAGIATGSVDLVFLGLNGDHEEDRAYESARALFPEATLACFKPLCGEYYTANAFGLWMAWSALRTGSVPPQVVLRGRSTGGFRTALVHDHFQLKDHALMLLGR